MMCISRLTVSVYASLLLFCHPFGVQAEAPSLVDIRVVAPTIVVDLKYATSENFMGEVLYPTDRCLLRPGVAERLIRVQSRLQKEGLGLKIFDGYRPLSVQQKMFARFPYPGFVADPSHGSNHNRGAAVDVTLVDGNGRELPMPSAYDEFTERSRVDYRGGTQAERQNRSLLQNVMKEEGFLPIQTEWWHFNDPDAKSYDVLDVPAEDV